MFVIFGSKEMTKTVANIYIWNLAVADTLFLVTLPFSSTQRVLQSWPFGAGMCKVRTTVKPLVCALYHVPPSHHDTFLH